MTTPLVEAMTHLSDYKRGNRGDIGDFAYLASGITRSVYTHPKFPDVVFKVGSPSCNSSEIYLWDRMDEINRARLAPIVGRLPGHHVIAMEYIKGPVFYDYTQAWMDKHDILEGVIRTSMERRFYKICQMLEKIYDLEDVHGGNIVYCPKRAKFVIVDYAD